MKLRIKNSGVSGRIALIAAIFGTAAFIVFLIYGVTYSAYADLGVAIALLLGVISYVAYIAIEQPLAEILPLAGVIATGIGMNIFFLNSYTVWADWYGNFNMYGSQGGITPVIVILVICVLSILSGIVACYTRKKGDDQ